MSEQLIDVIEGAKGKGGGSARAAVEAPNTLSSRAIVRVVEVLSEGEIVGLENGAKDVFINDTPLMNADNSENFARTSFDSRVGLPDQAPMAGFSAAEAEFTIGTVVTTAAPWTRTSTSATVDAVYVTIALPQGLMSQNTTNGDTNGTEVSFELFTKLTSSGSWVSQGTRTISGKTTTATEKQYRIERPGSYASGGTGAALGTWDVRVVRTTPDSAVSSLRNQIAVSRITEVQDVNLPYNNTAVVGVAIDAESVGNQIPRRSYLVKGVKVKVPSNYNPVTRAYSGLWNGTFQTAWTDNPAWVLYDLITHPRYGLGEFIAETDVDKFSFYDAAVYADQLVPDGKGGQEPRFTFNSVVQSRDHAFRLLSAVAGSMRANLIYANGQVKVIQDRPEDPVKLVSKANVIDGLFDYRSSGLMERHTAFNVTFNDKADRYLQRTVTVDTSNITAIASSFATMLQQAEDRYGYNSTDIAAFGATTEGQAIRQALWSLDTEINQTEIVQFKMSFNGFDLFPGDIVELFDEDYAASRGAGRVISVTGTTVVLDREITLTVGSKIDVLLADGITIERRNIVETAGTTSTVTVDSAFSQTVLAGADFIATLAVAPRQFRVIGLKQDDESTVSVEAVYHDPNKFSRVEQNINVPAAVFSAAPVLMCSAPQTLSFREVQVNDSTDGLNGIRRSLLLSWVAPVQGVPTNYAIRYRVNKGEWTLTSTTGCMFEIAPAYGGEYEVDISAVAISGSYSPSLTGAYTIQTTGGGASPLNAPTTLQLIGGGTAFSGVDLNVEFTNPASNATVLTATLRDFEVRFIETSGSTTVRTVYVPAVAAGQKQTVSYTYAMNTADGGPRRSVQVQVRCRDASNNLSNPATVTFTNAAPAVPSNIAVTGGLASTKISMTLPTDPDFKGIIVWRGTTSGFTTSANPNSTTPNGGYIYDGSDSFIADNALTDNTTYYYKVAAYDVFAKNLAGTGLNVSGQFSATTAAGAGIARGATLPGSGAEGDLFFLTTDDKLYRYTGSAWTAAVATTDLSGTIGAAQIAAGAIDATKFANGIEPVEIVATLPSTGNFAGRIAFLTTDNKLYRYTGSAWTAAIAAADITGQVTDAQVAAVAAAKVTGQVVSTQIADTAITATKIAAGAVTNAKISANAIGESQLIAGAVTAAKLSINRHMIY